MAGPRLIKLTCPECGASLSVGRGETVATCGYCRKSSWVHWPDQPQPPSPAAPEYGHIHVPRAALRTVGLAVILTAVLPLVLIAVVGVVIAVFTSARPAPMPPVTISPASPAGPAAVPAGRVCEKVVACCKAIQPQNAGCDGLRALSEEQCGQQLDSLSMAAKMMGKSCN